MARRGKGGGAANLVLAVLALAAILLGFWNLRSATDGLSVKTADVDGTPVTVYQPAAGPPAPVVIIAHGFAGSQQLMQPFAITLARNGYVAVTFDFQGHGRNPKPLRGSLIEAGGAGRNLIGELARVAAFARALPGSDGRLAVLGHSMASDIVVRYAQENPEVEATIAVSMFSPGVTATTPRNLLVIVGAWEPAMLRDEGIRVVTMASGGELVRERTTYGSFADGTARRVSYSGGVEHIGVLYSADSLHEALDWANAVFGRSGDDLATRFKQPDNLGLTFTTRMFQRGDAVAVGDVETGPGGQKQADNLDMTRPAIAEQHRLQKARPAEPVDMVDVDGGAQQ